MRILLTSHGFPPDVGGVETMALQIAAGFQARGHEVVVATETLSGADDNYPFRVLRRPSFLELLRVSAWSDVVFQNNISLRTIWPALLLRKPWVVRHATWICRVEGALSWRDRLKRFLLRYSLGISNSKAVADHLPVPTQVIGNPYRDDQFRLRTDVVRDRDLVFLGRLVSDKGPHLLLKALQALREQDLKPSLTIIGDGPERGALMAAVQKMGMETQVEFLGAMQGDDLVIALNRHRIMVVPSLWSEPFGIVALEGAACGCVVVGSEAGGLKDAIGPCGLTFPNGDAAALVACLSRLLVMPEERARLGALAPAHLARHRANIVIGLYLAVVEKAVSKKLSGRAAAADKN